MLHKILKGKEKRPLFPERPIKKYVLKPNTRLGKQTAQNKETFNMCQQTAGKNTKSKQEAPNKPYETEYYFDLQSKCT